jgi:hypothetical protein
MPKFEKLSKQEVRRIQAPGGRIELVEYATFLQTLRPGDWARVVIAPTESARAVKRRLGTVSKLLGKRLHYYDSGKKKELLFSVDREGTARARKRAGRPRKLHRQAAPRLRAAKRKAPAAVSAPTKAPAEKPG